MPILSLHKSFLLINSPTELATRARKCIEFRQAGLDWRAMLTGEPQVVVVVVVGSPETSILASLAGRG